MKTTAGVERNYAQLLPHYLVSESSEGELEVDAGVGELAGVFLRAHRCAFVVEHRLEVEGLEFALTPAAFDANADFAVGQIAAEVHHVAEGRRELEVAVLALGVEHHRGRIVEVNGGAQWLENLDGGEGKRGYGDVGAYTHAETQGHAAYV